MRKDTNHAWKLLFIELQPTEIRFGRRKYIDYSPSYLAIFDDIPEHFIVKGETIKDGVPGHKYYKVEERLIFIY